MPKEFAATVNAILGNPPKEAWIIAVKNATEVVREVLAPLTSTTIGLGRLIQAKFDGMVEVQKVLAADVLRRTQSKIADKPVRPTFNPAVVIAALEESSKQAEEEIREMWASLLAEELIEGGVHPELVRALSRMTSKDAEKLRTIAKNRRFRSFVSRTPKDPKPWVLRHFVRSPRDVFTYDVLIAIGLVRRDQDQNHALTSVGQELLRIVGPGPEKQREEESEVPSEPG